MELKNYLIPLRKWWWLLLVATSIAAISSFFASLGQPKFYQARTTLMIGRTIEDPNPSSGEFQLGQQLAATYADVASRDLVRNATMESLGLRRLPEYDVRTLPNNQLIEIVVNDTDPERAMVVANELAAQLILLSPTSALPEEQDRQEFVNKQLDTLEKQIEDTQNEISKLEEELGDLDSALQITDTQDQISALQTKLTTLQSNYGTLLSNTGQGAINTLSVVEPAVLPTNPISSNRGTSVMLAAAIGFSLAAGAAYLLEYLDDTFKTPEEITRTLGVPVIGFIGETGTDGDSQNLVYVSKHPRSPIAEAYRSLRANLEFSAVDKPLRTILVASADSAAGKSSVAANLAAIIAQGEKKVVLMDADLRKPSLHTFTDLSKENGLSDLFRNGAEVTTSIKYWQDGKFGVITGGESPPNPAELLGSRRMDGILTTLGASADVVVIDSPPFVVSDALMLAAKVDGVLLVIRPGYTRRNFVQAMMEQLNRSGARILGVVMNRIPHRGAEYYGGYLYYSPYYADGHYTSEESPDGVQDSKVKSGVTEKIKRWKPHIEISKYLRSIKPRPIRPVITGFREKIRTAIQNRREPQEYTTVYLGDEEPEVFDINMHKD